MIYRLKATLPNNKNFLRVYEVKADSTLYAFHLFLQNDLSFSPDQQLFFRSMDATGGTVHEYGLFDIGNGSMDQVRLDALHQKGVQEIQYIFDIFKGRYLILHFEGIEEELARKTYPRTIMEQGGDPGQFREDQMPLELTFDESDSGPTDDDE